MNLLIRQVPVITNSGGATVLHNRGMSLVCASRRSLGTIRCRARKLVAFDFDGVVCDSVGESSESAWIAAAEVWPHIFGNGAALEKKPTIIDQMRAVRPVVETGYENIVQIRCLYEGVSVEDMLEDWESILQRSMKTWGLDRGTLVKLFGNVRDTWIERDLDSWLAPNRMYSGVPEMLNNCLQQHETYIVTTKQAHYTEILLKQMANVAFPSSRIFSQTLSGRPKTEVLEMLATNHGDLTDRLFIEDKLSTLEKVCQCPTLEDWRLYLVDWGYNMERERERARGNPRIEVVGLSELGGLLS